MKRRIRFGFFGYLTVDYKAAQAYLDQRAGEGWALAEVWMGLVARFRRTDRTDLHYELNIAAPVAEDTPEYRARCRAAGWERLYTVRYMNIYRSLPGAETVPLQAEDREACRRYRGNVARWCAVCALLMVLLSVLQYARFLLIGLPTVGSLLRLSAASGASAFLLAAMPFVLAGGTAYLIWSLRRSLQWRAAAEAGRPFPTPGAAGARARGILTLLSYLGTASLVFCVTVDLVSLPTAKPVGFLAVVTAAAFLVTACTGGTHMRQPRRVRLWRCVGLAVFVALVGVGRGVFAPAFDAMRADTMAELPALEAPYETVEAYSSLLLSYARAADGPPGTGELVVEYYDCRTPRMADRMARALWNWDMEPVEGLENAWLGERGGRYNWLSLEGHAVRLVSLPAGGVRAEDREALLDWVLK